MSERDLISILPMLFLSGGIILTMLLVAFKRNHKLAFIASTIVLLVSFVSVFFITSNIPHSLNGLFLTDRFGLFFQSLMLLATLFVSIFSYIGIRNLFPEKRKEEYYLLLMIATLGAGMIAISTHFISFFVSLEVLSVSLYGLIGYYRQRTQSIEAGLKYLIIAAMSSAFLLFGMALIYAVSGEMAFQALAGAAPLLNTSSSLMSIAGWGLIIVGIGFKLAVVPFHMWTPDVYQGASAPVTAFIASVSKGAVVAVLIRLFVMADFYHFQKIMEVFTAISVLSMLVGNLLALLQNNVKRILAYSSIAHFGYALVALLSGEAIGPQAATFYVTTYIVAILTAFGLITIISRSDGEAEDIENYKSLFWRKPLLSAIFSIVLLSLAGIPLTAGFMGKYFILSAGVGSANWLLAFVLVISSVIGLFYYLRLIAMMMKPGETPQTSPTPLHFSATGILALAVLALIVIWLGIYPTWLMDLVNSIALVTF